MAPRDKKHPPREDKAASEYYELKTKAVDELVNANVTNSPEVSDAELRKYRKHGRFAIPEPVKYFLVKWWVAGVICYFIWLPVQQMGNWELMVFGTGLATGILMHVIANAVYGAVLSLFAFMTYAVTGLNTVVGPILYGIFVAVWDLIFLMMKRLMRRIIEDAKKNAD